MSVLTPMELHASTTFPQSSLLGHCNRKCSTVSALVLHLTHFLESVTFNLARYSFRRHFSNRSLVIVVFSSILMCIFNISRNERLDFSAKTALLQLWSKYVATFHLCIAKYNDLSLSIPGLLPLVHFDLLLHVVLCGQPFHCL